MGPFVLAGSIAFVMVVRFVAIVPEPVESLLIVVSFLSKLSTCLRLLRESTEIRLWASFRFTVGFITATVSACC